MLIIMKPNSTPQQVENVIEQIKEAGLAAHLSQGIETTLIGAIGETHDIQTERFEVLDGVEMVKRITQPFKLASRQFHPENSIFPLDGFQVGGNEIVVIAGPCAVESRSQILETAHAVSEEPGLRHAAQMLAAEFPQVPVHRDYAGLLGAIDAAAARLQSGG